MAVEAGLAPKKLNCHKTTVVREINDKYVSMYGMSCHVTMSQIGVTCSVSLIRHR